MNCLRVLTCCLVLVVGGQVWAGCSQSTAKRVQPGSEINSLLNDNTVCGNRIGGNGDQWQEWHQAGNPGILTEYAKGPNDTVDPSHDVGRWSTSGDGANSMVSYTYDNDSGGPYEYNVYYNDNSDTYSFCSGGTEEVIATIKSGQVACGF